ncbi:MAG: histidine--tRNA ligase [Nitrospina sp.]|jgi:histidyl-tRNA synthetase|nr:histidine--tRNA ligase [Nitrospina sp.]MBT3510429.1 histidine--tRNA ligase [Nitrospina sp.]MBT3875810.1 histidine--tRNA ligase [Nitrospina sp.]MBT4049257.1 histidine--tRNA ligase [Nitrospina sp.]MBT4557225.1 histidine--tRNA ligase [Nitrospina sp.]
MKIQSIRGVKDILPDEIWKWQYIESVAHNIFPRYGFKEIRLPIFEDTRLFSRSIGETTDIVEKEMYTFSDRSGDSITLRPEGTASVVRAYVEHKMYNPPSVLKMFYIGPMFRYERPQAGRLRQFNQIGVEAMGSPSPIVDVEVMTMLMEFFKELGLKEIKLEINSLGSQECRPRYRELLQAEIEKHLDQLCSNCTGRYQRNPLRVLDCKVEQCGKIAEELPKLIDHLDTESAEHFSEVRSLLDSAGTPYSINPRLVRGLDYYNRTAFEVTSQNLGAQNAICGGGRYDTLVEELDGPSTPCFGFALGLERLVSLVPFEDIKDLQKNPDIFIVCLGEEAKTTGFQIAHELRLKGFKVERDYEMGSMKSQMRKANKTKSQFSLILGENEIKSGKLALKNMETGEQIECPAQELATKMAELSPNKL